MAEPGQPQRMIERLRVLLDPLMYPPRPDHPVIAPYAAIDTCGHVDLPDGRAFALNVAELHDLMAFYRERQARLIARNPARAAEKAPGCPQCFTERFIAGHTEPLDWRRN